MKNKVIIILVIILLLGLILVSGDALAAPAYEHTITSGTNGTPFDLSTLNGGLLKVDTTEVVELTGDGGSASVHLYPYSEVVLIDVTLESAPDNHAISLLSGENKIILYGSNLLRGGDNCCAIYVPGISELYVHGPGELEAYSGQFVIRNSAAIGTGYWDSGNTGIICLYGGTITADGTAGNGAGIGSGSNGDGGDVIIDGSNVTAYGGLCAAAIGGGYGADGYITVISGNVTAYGGPFASGIGGGTDGNGIVTIEGGNIKATGGSAGAGIGGGYSTGIDGGGCNIDIRDGRVETFDINGSQAGIGGGYQNVDPVDISISGGIVIARGGSEAIVPGEAQAGIGGGFDGTVNSITITGGQVYAIGGDGGTPDDIGIGSSGTLAGSITLDGFAAVFPYNDRINASATVYKERIDGEIVTNNSAYGYNNFPDEFNDREGIGYIARGVAIYDYCDPNPGFYADQVEVCLGGTIDKPTDPTREGYVFNGWHKGADGTEPFYFATTLVNEDIVLYAHWLEDNQYQGGIGGKLVDYYGNNLKGYGFTLESEPNVVATSSNGKYSFGTVHYTDHTLIIKSRNGNVLKTYNVIFSSGSEESATVDEGSSTINITYTTSTVNVNIPVKMGLRGDSAMVSGDITFSNVVNPRTGDANNLAYLPYLILVVVFAWLGMCTFIFIKKRVKSK